MNKEELTELLKEIAENDLNKDADIYDHPCSVAIRALDQCFDDIGILKGVVKRSSASYSKKVAVLIKMSYKPSW
jgi:hypothetical protein